MLTRRVSIFSGSLLKLFHDILMQLLFVMAMIFFMCLLMLFAHAFCFLRGAYARFAKRVSTLESFRSWDIGDEQPAKGQIWPSPRVDRANKYRNRMDVTEANLIALFNAINFCFCIVIVERKYTESMHLCFRWRVLSHDRHRRSLDAEAKLSTTTAVLHGWN